MNMTPMIDVVFLLNIFFITVAQVSEVNRVPLELPVQQGSEDQQPSILTINIDESGQLIIGGTVYHLSELAAFAADEVARLGNDPSRLKVVLRADRRVPSSFVNRTVNALAQLDIRKVRIPVQVPH
jgi:biopolymer transport protein ExbD